jgi:hypothetical protein
LQAVFFGERKVKGEAPGDPADPCPGRLGRPGFAVATLVGAERRAALGILQACGQLARQLHGVRQVHGCFIPSTFSAG